MSILGTLLKNVLKGTAKKSVKEGTEEVTTGFTKEAMERAASETGFKSKVKMVEDIPSSGNNMGSSEIKGDQQGIGGFDDTTKNGELLPKFLKGEKKEDVITPPEDGKSLGEQLKRALPNNSIEEAKEVIEKLEKKAKKREGLISTKLTEKEIDWFQTFKKDDPVMWREALEEFPSVHFVGDKFKIDPEELPTFQTWVHSWRHNPWGGEKSEFGFVPSRLKKSDSVFWKTLTKAQKLQDQTNKALKK